ncbi:MAG: NinH [Pseudomonadota bacterium]
MTHQLASIPNMLKIQPSLTALAEILGVDRSTIRRLKHDIKCENHIVVNGVLMTSTRIRRKRDV